MSLLQTNISIIPTFGTNPIPNLLNQASGSEPIPFSYLEEIRNA